MLESTGSLEFIALRSLARITLSSSALNSEKSGSIGSSVMQPGIYQATMTRFYSKGKWSAPILSLLLQFRRELDLAAADPQLAFPGLVARLFDDHYMLARSHLN